MIIYIYSIKDKLTEEEKENQKIIFKYVKKFLLFFYRIQCDYFFIFIFHIE
jgi:hypothetical protein